MDDLDKIMKRNGFNKVLYPIDNPKDKKFAEWYVKTKVPYGSAISKPQLKKILEDVAEYIKLSERKS